MPIIRNGIGDYQRTKVKKPKSMQRKAEDFDLAWADHRVYIIDAHEWFDPHTSTKYHDGVSRHAMYGPSLIIVNQSGGGYQTYETYVNDPVQWAWIRRSIAEGYLTADSLNKSVPCDEKEVVVKG